jgi:hypothetical protein
VHENKRHKRLAFLKTACQRFASIKLVLLNYYKRNFITGQNEREETTQNTTVTKSAACASYTLNPGVIDGQVEPLILS